MKKQILPLFHRRQFWEFLQDSVLSAKIFKFLKRNVCLFEDFGNNGFWDVPWMISKGSSSAIWMLECPMATLCVLSNKTFLKKYPFHLFNFNIGQNTHYEAIREVLIGTAIFVSVINSLSG